jgi:hypothetical protein
MPIFLISDIQQTFWMIAEFGIKNQRNCISAKKSGGAKGIADGKGYSGMECGSEGCRIPGMRWQCAGNWALG